jgi:DNA-binding response OmpR family regulator
MGMRKKERSRIMSNILLLEDDLSLINGLSFALRKQGYGLEVARTIKEVDTVWAEGKYDLLILDVSLPDGSGFEICEKVRQTSKVPIIFLTASDEEVNIIMGLDMGGDDYITKPFKLGVLLSRINALLRRAGDFSQTETEIYSNGLKAVLTQGKVYKNGELLDLTAGEYKLLCLFMQNPGTVLSKEQILEKLWDNEGNYIDNNTLNVYIRRLRTKVEDNPSNPQMILTVRRMGYKWNII